MIMHMLGGGPAQLGALARMEELGYETALSDLNPGAPGFELVQYRSEASTFDTAAVLRDAARIGSDCLITTGTDQPVLTAARVSEELGLPYFLTPGQALMVTNKKVMKTAMAHRSIPTRKFTFLSQGFGDDELKGLDFPLVIKPLDSQGQRGVMKVESIREIRENISHVLSFSREKEILAEEFYNSKELTISGWVEKGIPHILSITDRVTVDNGPHLGVCVSHRYPSLCHHDWAALEKLTGDLTDMIGLEKGPLYFQILHGDEGYQVNEIACRLGGAYEDEFLPWLCGVPLLDLMIEMTAGKRYDTSCLKRMGEVRQGKYLSLQMFFCRPGVIELQEGMDAVRAREGILRGRFLLKPGTEIVKRENSTQRAGYFIATADSPDALNRLIKESYGLLSLKDDQAREMIQFYDNMLFPE